MTRDDILIPYLLLTLSPVLLPSAYDAYSACSKPFRTSKFYAEPPCDFRVQPWCTIPGSAYPWQAVRRFVRENQGLMRRMYGDERHISVLRAEIESNDVEYLTDSELKLRDEVRQRYSSRIPSRVNPASFGGRSPSIGGHAPIPATSRTPATTSRTVPTTTQAPSTTQTTTTTANVTKASPTTATLLRNANHESGETESEQDTTPVYETSTNSTLEVFDSSTTEPAYTTIPAGTTINDVGEPTMNDEVGDATEEEEAEEVEMTTIEQTTDNVRVTEEMTTMKETDLFQASKDPVEVSEKSPPLLKLKGVNACPVKEEVVAPFWANNTRGETLALLNVYPFEQYVHWEKCTYENKQMFCRNGCRCEQQYRLHRLLAYDPSNECRGIFSDWFKFPSCCVCRCYDLPIEFHITSRSPRIKANEPPYWYKMKPYG